MKLKAIVVILSVSAIGGLSPFLHAGVAFPEPPGGWTYLFDGDQRTYAEDGAGFASLDGTWSHDNGSDQWDGSEIGGEFAEGNGPGGVNLMMEDGVTFLRFQDTGDPRDYDYPDPSNRKIYLGHDLEERGASASVLDDGITLTFRARIPTSGPLDPLHRDGQEDNGVVPYPEEGDGYVTSDGGKGNFVIRQASGGAIAVSLTQVNDTTGGAFDPPVNTANFAGLTMNEFNGNEVTGGGVNFGQGTGTNVLAFDPTEWHEFWIVYRKDPADVGTHQGFFYMDGSLTPSVFRITAGTGNDYPQSYLAIGMTATPQNAALDMDFVGYKLGAEFPPGALDNLPPEILDLVPENGATFYPAGDGISFRATTGRTNSLPENGLTLTLNGRDVSSSLTVSGSEQERTVSFAGLEPNLLYEAEIIVADQMGRATTNTIEFDTFDSEDVLSIEAEDFNFNNGQFEDDPPPSGESLDGVPVGGFGSGYFETFGTPDVDYFDTDQAGDPATHTYRSFDLVGTRASSDTRRPKYLPDNLPEFEVTEIVAGEWLNYTRTFSEDEYAVFLRASSTANQSIELSRVTSNRSQPNQQTEELGVFNVARTGARFDYFPLMDPSGQNRQTVSLSGVETLRLTAPDADEDINLNFILLAPASDIVVPPPDIQLAVPTLANGQLTLGWSGGAAPYTVQKKESLSSSTWTDVITTSETSASVPMDTPKGFFRVTSGGN